MQNRISKLTAGHLYDIVNIGGKQWKLGNVSDKSAKIDVTWTNAAGGTIAEWTAIQKRATYSPPEGFAGFRLSSDKPVDVEYYITDGHGTFEVDVDITGQKIEVTNTAADPLFIATPPGQTLPVSFAQPNGCGDAIHVDVCPPPQPEYRNRNERNIANNNTMQWRVFDPARQHWMLRNVHPEAVWIAIGGDNLDDENAVIVLKPGDMWYEDNPLVAQQPIFIRTVPDYAGGGFPNGSDAIFTYSERV